MRVQNMICGSLAFSVLRYSNYFEKIFCLKGKVSVFRIWTWAKFTLKSIQYCCYLRSSPRDIMIVRNFFNKFKFILNCQGIFLKLKYYFLFWTVWKIFLKVIILLFIAEQMRTKRKGISPVSYKILTYICFKSIPSKKDGTFWSFECYFSFYF